MLRFHQWRSRPRLIGARQLRGLAEPVAIARDIDGIVLIEAGERPGAIFALGYIHAQERFFQMDMLRRTAAGERAALLGEGLIDADRRARLHRFRIRAQAILGTLSTPDTALVETYRQGVNAGLRDLRAMPWEYRLLRCEPEPWACEDTLLVMHALFLQLTDGAGEQEYQRHQLFSHLPLSAAEFLSAAGSPGDIPMVGSAAAAPPIPATSDIDLSRCDLRRLRDRWLTRRPVSGSNGWALSASTEDGDGAILANDVHLPFALPNLFFRAALTCRDETMAGFTIPGVPFVLAGSNGYIAWGITNAAVRTGRLIAIDPATPDGTRYRSRDGDHAIRVTHETVLVRGAAPQSLHIKETVWGPIVRRSRAGIEYALQWSAHDPDAINMGWRRIEASRSLDDVKAVAPVTGCPPLAIVIADRDGRAGWTVAGRLAVFDDAPVAAAAFSSRLRPGPLRQAAAGDYPWVVATGGGNVWSANDLSITAGRGADLLRNGPNSSGLRAAQLGATLAAMHKPLGFADMLLLQLDTRAPGMRSWQRLLARSLAGNREDPALAAIAAAIDGWDGRASVDSMAYRAIRLFREEAIALVFEPFVALVRVRSGEAFDLAVVSDHLESRAIELLAARPGHLLAPWFENWTALLDEATDRLVRAVAAEGGPGEFSWGAANRLDMRHPLAGRLPQTRSSPSPQPLSGDMDVPLAQTSRHGPLYRLIVRPGMDFTGSVQMAGGQAGNPAAPYYLAGHDRWVEGIGSPLWPQEAVWRLTLLPG